MGETLIAIGFAVLFLSLLLVEFFGKGDEGVSRGFWSIALVGCIIGVIGSVIVLLS